jgi:hypothetical protein
MSAFASNGGMPSKLAQAARQVGNATVAFIDVPFENDLDAQFLELVA